MRRGDSSTVKFLEDCRLDAAIFKKSFKVKMLYVVVVVAAEAMP